MAELHLSEERLARRCTKLAEEMFAEPERFYVTRERIAKILMNGRHTPCKSAAKVITGKELRVLAVALQVSPEWLLGQEHDPEPILWDPLAGDQRMDELLHVMEYYEVRSGEALVWGRGLMCSLTTPELTHAYHEALFDELEAVGLREEKQRLVAFYDAIGQARRTQRFRRGSAVSFTQLILRSDLAQLAQGTGLYRSVKREVRERALEHLSALLEAAAGWITLVVIEDRAVQDLQPALWGFESIGVCAHKAVFLRQHNGAVIWSGNARQVDRYARLLRSLHARAASRDRSTVLELLETLRATTR
jgi:hypothetical protein